MKHCPFATRYVLFISNLENAICVLKIRETNLKTFLVLRISSHVWEPTASEIRSIWDQKSGFAETWFHWLLNFSKECRIQGGHCRQFYLYCRNCCDPEVLLYGANSYQNRFLNNSKHCGINWAVQCVK